MEVLRRRSRRRRPGRLAAGLLIATALCSSGCMSGLLYTHTTVPLDVDMNATPRMPDQRGGSWTTLVIPIVVASIRVDWGDMGIAEAARARGVETVYYADVETVSVLGLFTQRTIHVYGE